MRKGAILGISSILALSMIALFASNAMAQDAPTIDTGDNAWLLASSALVLIMTPGLALFYGGMVRAKNMVNTLWLSFIVICIISMQWILWAIAYLLHQLTGLLVVLNGVDLEQVLLDKHLVIFTLQPYHTFRS